MLACLRPTNVGNAKQPSKPPAQTKDIKDTKKEPYPTCGQNTAMLLIA